MGLSDEEETGETTTTPPPTTNEEPTAASFYRCSFGGSDVVGNNIDSAKEESPSSLLPENVTKITLVYDYEIHTLTPPPLDTRTQSSFEDGITYDLARRYGLIDCRRRRRYLRSLLMDGGSEVVALDSHPMDESMAGTYECNVQVAASSRSGSSCTSMRGRMTAWLLNSLSSVELAQKETELLEYIESGMTSDSYTSGNVLKATYVGARTSSSSAQQGVVHSINNADGGGGKSEAVGIATTATVETTNKSNTSDKSLLAGGIILLIVAIGFIGLLLAYKRKHNRKFYSDGPEEDDLTNPSAAAAAAGRCDIVSRDPDDVQLLPSPDKMDLRSIHSSDSILLSDAETENYSHHDEDEDDGWSKRYDAKYGEDYSDQSNRNNDAKKGTQTPVARISAGSELAAMGMASTLVMQSYNSNDAYLSPTSDVESDEAKNDDNDDLSSRRTSEQDDQSGIPHMGTVVDELDYVSTMSSKEEYYILP